MTPNYTYSFKWPNENRDRRIFPTKMAQIVKSLSLPGGSRLKPFFLEASSPTHRFLLFSFTAFTVRIVTQKNAGFLIFHQNGNCLLLRPASVKLGYLDPFKRSSFGFYVWHHVLWILKLGIFYFYIGKKKGKFGCFVLRWISPRSAP